MFPAPVGMNRMNVNEGVLHLDVPRACGDEPVKNAGNQSV